METRAEDSRYLLENKSNTTQQRAQTVHNIPQNYSNNAEERAETLENSPQQFQQPAKRVENSPILPPKFAIVPQSELVSLQLEIQQPKDPQKLEVLENSHQPVKGEELQTLEIFGSYLEEPPVGALQLQKQANFQLDEEQLEIAKNLKFQSYEAILKGIIKTQNTISAYKGRGADYSHYTKELNRLKALKDAYTANQLKPKNKGGKNA